jgi:hypothetical protein
MLELLDTMGGEPTLDYGGSVHRRIIPVEEPLLGHHLWSVHQQVLPELAQDIHNADPIDGGIHGCDVGIDEAPRIKESKDRLLAAAGLHLGLQWAKLALQSLLFASSFGLRCIVRNHCLVHGDNIVQHGQPAVLDGSDKIITDSHPPLFLPFRQHLWHLAR